MMERNSKEERREEEVETSQEYNMVRVRRARIREMAIGGSRSRERDELF
jgi:hypothetical protein